MNEPARGGFSIVRATDDVELTDDEIGTLNGPCSAICDTGEDE